ncbi:hypothetical protein SH580_00765 [Coraliomargarita algicola]|uniref:Uncharacterized protein n=1 Tax=Coraliomargarita algicola TaxID=3092156 RepID=A0ABZ0RMT5_9BACT|nr:hypothetical protein [Coraliomargarita sp. J2-16]WPJ96232.1 hypothetical protein SH580_00765 [Coraliomargarita sp. J2-16]
MKKLHIIYALFFAAHTWAAELNVTTPLVEMLDRRVTQAPKMHRLPELDQGAVQAIQYETLPAEIDADTQLVSADLPESYQTYYVNLKDSRGYLISSVLVELDL